MDAGRIDLKSQPLNSLKESKQAHQAAKREGKTALPHLAGRGGGEEISAEDQESKQRGVRASPGSDAGSS